MEFEQYEASHDIKSEVVPTPHLSSLEITIKKRAQELLEKEKRKGVTKAEREAATELHKAHLVTLICNRVFTSQWLDDEFLQVASR